ncbi:MAG TPA: serine/threonine-protein kinase [Arenibacter sp.]|nr:serine/threonine-protein kinase [Arenibacter sp.]
MKLNQYEWDPENDKLGEGAFAEVFRTKDIYANRYVALKIYKTSVKASTLGNTGQVKYSMEQEFQNVESVSHTNIIKYYGLNYIKHVDAMGREGNYPVIIMEYANEGTLTEFLKQNPDRSVLDKLIRDLIMGVGHLHEEGLLHRDLKPGIILVTKNKKGIPTAKITDFGISKDTLSSESHTTSHTEMIGTPHYMAPEQIYQKKFGLEGRISQRTDLWAIGAIIYKMFTHRVPFADGTQDLELVREGITTGEYDLTGVPMTYHALLAQCFKKNASERIASADQMLKLIGKTDNTMTRQDDKDMEATVIRPRKIESLQKKEDVKGTLDTLYSKKEKDDKRPIDIASVLSKLQKIVLVAYVVINTLFPQSLYNHLLCTVTFVT